MKAYKLKYGCNPHQKPAEILSIAGELPFNILNGNPGYINFMDALNSWQLVKELKTALNMPAAASFKHVSPAGAAIGLPLSGDLKKAYFVDDIELSPLADAYVRARGADRMSSFGDWAALSDVVDKATALVLKREVSDGVIAPGFTPKALEILKQKKGGKYNIIEIAPTYEPDEMETRSIYGVEFVQRRNNVIPCYEDLMNIVTENRNLSDEAKRDMIIAIGTNADGSKNEDYCHYCYKDGAFTKDETMDEVIETCVPFVSKGEPWPDEETARKAMKELFPQMKRWKSEGKS